jgi:hypothetical protein
MKCTEILFLKIRLALPIIAPDEGKSFAVAELQQSPLLSLVSVGLSRLSRNSAGTLPRALITLHPRYDTTLPLPFYDGAAN